MRSIRSFSPTPALLAVVALLSALLVVALASRVPQALYSDPAWQLEALAQHVDGRSPSINERVHPDTADLSVDTREWIVWWAPGTQLATYPLVRSGLSIGAAVRVVAALCVVLGAVGWVLWFTRFPLPAPLLLALAVLFPWVRYASNGLHLYQAESLVFATMPWLLLGALALSRRLDRGGRAATLVLAPLFGVALGFSYVVKYSAAMASVGVLAFLALAAPAAAAAGGGRDDVTRRPRGRDVGAVVRAAAPRLGAVALCAVGFALPVLALNVVNHRHGAAANLVAASAGLRLGWRPIAWAVADLPLAMADADAMWRFLLLNPSHPLVSGDGALLVVGLLGGVPLLWLLGRALRHAPHDRATLLALAVGASSVGALLVIWFTSMVSYEARHLATAAFALLPLALVAGLDAWRGARRPVARRAVLAAAALGYVALPLAYGVVAHVGKSRRLSGYATGPSGLANPLMAPRDLRRCLQEATVGFDVAHDVWYAPEPMASIDLPGRVVIGTADLGAPEWLRTLHYRTRRPLRVRVLLPPALEAQGKGDIVRGSFVGARDWVRHDFPDCVYAAWDATVLPTPPAS